MKKIFIIAGEQSGDLQASKLMREMNKITEIQWNGIGGDLMINNGLNCIKHMKEMAFMGFWEVIKHLPEILKNLKLVKSSLLEFRSEAVILVDYPGFNLKIAKFAKNNNFKVIYYITPQLWAWHKGRVKLMKKYVDEIINVFPFEVDFYSQYGIKSHYFGHPITEGLQPTYQTKKKFLTQINVSSGNFIAILPGSRLGEVEKNMSVLNKFINSMPTVTFLVAKVNHIELNVYNLLPPNAKLVENFTYDLITYCDMAFVASGTATLETACLETPLVVIYRTNPLTYLIAKALVKLPYISLVNIVAGKQIVPELIQNDLTAENLSAKYNYLISYREQIVANLKQVKAKLAAKNVSLEVAKFILSKLNIAGTN